MDFASKQRPLFKKLQLTPKLLSAVLPDELLKLSVKMAFTPTIWFNLQVFWKNPSQAVSFSTIFNWLQNVAVEKKAKAK